MKITFLSDNKTENPACMAEWGLSVLIETEGKKLLFDVGASSLFADNAKALGKDLSDVDAVIISHGHYDHTQGLEEFCHINRTAPVYIHKNAISPAYGTDADGKIEEENCGIMWTKEFVSSISDRLKYTEKDIWLWDNAVLSSDIIPIGPMPETFYRPEVNGEAEGDRCRHNLVKDTMDHEQILTIKEPDGICIFSGCSHTGIISDIRRATSLFPGEKIKAVIAGMHLYPLSHDEKQKVVDEFERLSVEYVFPVHCTGMSAIMMFRNRMGSRCKIASAGDTYEF